MLSILVASQYRFTAAVGSLALLLVSVCSEASVMATQTLNNFTVSSTSSRYVLKAKADVGTIAKFADILAAKDVSVDLGDTLKNRSAAYRCSSFSFHINDSFAICDVFETKTSFLFDLKNSEINSYPLR